MKIYINFLIILMVTFMFASNSKAGLSCVHCGENMPLNIMGAGIPEPKEFRFKMSGSYMSMEGLTQDGDSIRAEEILGMPAMGKFMAVPTAMDMKMLSATLVYSFTHKLVGGVMVMKNRNSMDMEFNGPMSMMFGKGYTMESEGVGDTMLMAKYRFYADHHIAPKSQASVLFGLSLPTGSIDEKNKKHPNPMMADNQLPYGMQLGSGTYDPSIGLLYQGTSKPIWWGANLVYTARLEDNKRDYRLGDKATLDLYGMYQLSSEFLIHGQLNGKYEGKVDGVMKEGVLESAYMSPLWDTGSYGGSEVNFTAAFQYRPKPFNVIDVGVSVPLLHDSNGVQLENDYSVMVTWYKEIITGKSTRH